MRADPERDGLGSEGLRQAVEAACSRPGSLRTLFQPIVDITRGQVTGYEALTRIELEPRMGPDRWFALAHELGLGTRLEAAALRSALAHREWLPPNCFLTVNVGPRALLEREVQSVFAQAGDLRGLVVELTEEAPVEDYVALHEVLDPIRAAGALVAVDDAGAGFASLRHITNLRPELIKIDREHIAGLHADGAKVAVVQALGDFASRLDAWVLAEGIETRAELETLTNLGVPLAQGYFLGRPAPAMTSITEDAWNAHAERSERRDSGTLGPLLDRVVSMPLDSAPAAIAAAFLAEPVEAVVLVDEYSRPIRLAFRDQSREHAPALSVDLDADLPTLARRLVLRPQDVRFDPVVVCDERGRVVGLLPAERVMIALAEAAATRT